MLSLGTEANGVPGYRSGHGPDRVGAASLLPDDSRVIVEHAGAAHIDEWRTRTELATSANPRYRWLGPLDRPASLMLLARATVLACTSRFEGGANAVSEAVAIGVPVVGADIGGNRGLLGHDHPGLVPVADHRALASLLYRLETEPGRLADLQRRVDRLQPITHVTAERDAWDALLGDLVT